MMVRQDSMIPLRDTSPSPAFVNFGTAAACHGGGSHERHCGRRADLINGRLPQGIAPISLLSALFGSTESRVARRRARAARWSHPISGAVHRVRAWAHMILADHGAWRLVYLNHHQVSHK